MSCAFVTFAGSTPAALKCSGSVLTAPRRRPCAQHRSKGAADALALSGRTPGVKLPGPQSTAEEQACFHHSQKVCSLHGNSIYSSSEQACFSTTEKERGRSQGRLLAAAPHPSLPPTPSSCHCSPDTPVGEPLARPARPGIPPSRPAAAAAGDTPRVRPAGELGEDAGRRLAGAANHRAAHVPHVSAASPSAAPAPHGVRGRRGSAENWGCAGGGRTGGRRCDRAHNCRARGMCKGVCGCPGVRGM